MEAVSPRNDSSLDSESSLHSMLLHLGTKTHSTVRIDLLVAHFDAEQRDLVVAAHAAGEFDGVESGLGLTRSVGDLQNFLLVLIVETVLAVAAMFGGLAEGLDSFLALEGKVTGSGDFGHYAAEDVAVGYHSGADQRAVALHAGLDLRAASAHHAEVAALHVAADRRAGDFRVAVVLHAGDYHVEAAPCSADSVADSYVVVDHIVDTALASAHYQERDNEPCAAMVAGLAAETAGDPREHHFQTTRSVSNTLQNARHPVDIAAQLVVLDAACDHVAHSVVDTVDSGSA